MSKNLKLVIDILLISVLVMLFSFVPENAREFFGDWQCQGSGEAIKDTYHYTGCNYGGGGYHDPEWHWGFRHYVWMLTGFAITSWIEDIGIFGYNKKTISLRGMKK